MDILELAAKSVEELAGEFGKSSAGQIISTLVSEVLHQGASVKALEAITAGAVPEAAPAVAAVEAVAPLAEKGVEELKELIAQAQAALDAKQALAAAPAEASEPPAA